MSKNSISLDEVKDLIVTFAKEHPGWAAIGTGIGCGLAYSIPKLGPTIETCWKYTVDKVIDCFPKVMTQPALAEEETNNVSSVDLSNDPDAV